MNHLNKSLGFISQKTEQWCRNKKKKHETNIVQKWNFKLLRIRLQRPCMSVPDTNIITATMEISFSGRAAVSQSMPPVIDLSTVIFPTEKLLFLGFNAGDLHLRKPEVFLGKLDIPNLPTLPKKKYGKKNKETRNNQVNMFSSWWFQPISNILVKMGSSSPG